MAKEKEKDLFYLMQMAGGTFPSGGFSQSWGLETYVAEGRIKDEADFIMFAESYLESAVACCEGPIAIKAMRLAADWDDQGIEELEELSIAVKVVK